MRSLVWLFFMVLIAGCTLCPPAGPWPMPPWCSSENTASLPEINTTDDEIVNTAINVTGYVSVITPVNTNSVLLSSENYSISIQRINDFYFKRSVTLPNDSLVTLTAYDSNGAVINSNSFSFTGELFAYISEPGSGRDLIKGYTFTACHYCQVSYTRGNFLNYVNDSFDIMKSEGVNWVNLIPVWFLDDIHSNELRPIYREEYGIDGWSGWMHSTISDDEVKNIIRWAHDRGLKVFLMPHVSTLNWSETVLGKGDLAPTDPDAFFNNYISFQEHYASIAQEEGVELYSIGNELDSITDVDNTASSGYNKDAKWRSVISSVRGVYGGNLTYSCSCTQRDGLCMPERITFWDALDAIGFEWYTPLNSNNSASYSDLVSDAASIISSKIDRLHALYNKPVILTEYGWEAKPYSWTKSYGGGGQGNFDKYAAVFAYDAFFEALKDKSSVAGMFINSWPLGDEESMTWIKDYNGLDTRFSIIESEIAKWYSYYR